MTTSARYERHLSMIEFSNETQQKIEQCKISLIGVGGVGNIIAYYLVAAGVGELEIMDFDIVEESNFNRQILYSDCDLGQKKVFSAKRSLERVNPNVKVTAIDIKITPHNILSYIKNTQLVIEAVDNFSTRKLLNKLCKEKGIKFVHAGVQGFQGQVLSVNPGESACFECTFPKIMDSGRHSFPVLGMVAGLAGSIAASEALKIITGWGDPLYNKMWIFDMKNCLSRIVQTHKNQSCPVCGTKGS